MLFEQFPVRKTGSHLEFDCQNRSLTVSVQFPSVVCFERFPSRTKPLPLKWEIHHVRSVICFERSMSRPRRFWPVAPSGLHEAWTRRFREPESSGLLKARSAQGAEGSNAKSDKTAVIMVWQPGGCSHLDTYDPKPDISSDYRGPFSTIDTKIPGVQFTELLPMQAAISDKIAVLRSMRQTAAGHPLVRCRCCLATLILVTNQSLVIRTG